MKSEIEYAKTNREKSQEAKRGLYWCCRCDAELIGQHGKCSNCGFIDKRKRKPQ